MNQSTSTLTAPDTRATQHAMLIVWGHFARTIGLMERLAQLPIAQKAVVRAPHEKLIELQIGLLAGMEHLSDLSAGAAPLANDKEVAAAWQLHDLADASGVSRTLQSCNTETISALGTALDGLGQPFLERAVSDLRQRNETLVLDADLTGRSVSSTSQTFPGAAFGYMDGEVRLGYQLAQVCLETHLFGRQWLSAQHHPGDTVSGNCLLGLLGEAERRLHCHPRRRTELVQERIRMCEQALAELREQTELQSQSVSIRAQRVAQLSERIHAAETQVATRAAAPLSTRQAGPYSKINRLRKQIGGWQSQCARAQAQLAHARAVAERQRQQGLKREQALRSECQRLQARYAQLCLENAQQAQPPRCRIRMDAGFSSGDNLSALIELGYEIETKSANPAVVQALRTQVMADASWIAVGKNAEMLGWPEYYLHTCPYPLAVGLERFHTPQGVRYAVLLRYRDAPQTASSDLAQWFHDYNGRQTIEAGNKEEKTTFKIQHLMSRSAAGIRIQAMFTVFAANFVRWADEWVRPRVEQSSNRFDSVLASPKRLVRIAANSSATVERSEGRELIRFSPLSSFNGVVIRLSVVIGRQLPLPLFTNDHFSSA